MNDRTENLSPINALPEICQVDPAACLKINEVMASNDITITSDALDFADWFEIYNPTDQSINLAGFYVTDAAGNLTKYRIPGNAAELTTIPPQGFLVFWADGEPDRGPLHCDFGLSASGEAVLLVRPNGQTIIDSYVFGPQLSDVSEGRFPDGADNWVRFIQPSPGNPNLSR